MTDEFFSVERPKDNLTQVYSREVIIDYATSLIRRKIPFSFGIVDIDNFKYVNDTYGHLSGDKILKTVSTRLMKLIGTIGAVGRFGGDEFLLVMPHLVDYDAVWTTCRSVMMFMNNFEIADFDGLFVTLTIGLARFPENASNYEELFVTADKALYRGKSKGRNCFVIYLPEKHSKINLKTVTTNPVNSIQMHAYVFSMLTSGPSLAEGICSLFNFFSSQMSIDHICIQTFPDCPDGGNKIYFEKTHEHSKNQSFLPMNLATLLGDMDSVTGAFYMNRISHLEEAGRISLLSEYKAQKIQSACAFEISICGKIFGMLRAESTSARVWQHTEIDILLTAAKTIALILHDRNLTFSDL